MFIRFSQAPKQKPTMLPHTIRSVNRTITQNIPQATNIIRAQNYSVAVIGAPFWNGQSKPGTELGPDGLRGTNLLRRLSKVQPNVVDFGNLNFDRKSVDRESMAVLREKVNNRSEYLLADMCDELSRFVGALCDTGYVPLTLGGDHSIAVGTVLGVTHSQKYRQKDISLIWVDAHADINTETSSDTGNLHGMPVSFLLKNCPTPKRPLFGKLTPTIDPKNVVYIGLRDLDMPELKLLKELKIQHFTMREVDKYGIEKVMEMSLDHVSGNDGANPIHVSFDIDSLDVTVTPSTGTAVPGGLTLREALRIGEIVHDTRRMIGLDMVEFNPLIGTPEQVKQTARATVEIILSFFGRSRLGDYHLMCEK